MLDDVPYTEVLDGRDAANAGEEASLCPQSLHGAKSPIDEL
jgi:hypothetical protein